MWMLYMTRGAAHCVIAILIAAMCCGCTRRNDMIQLSDIIVADMPADAYEESDFGGVKLGALSVDLRGPDYSVNRSRFSVSVELTNRSSATFTVPIESIRLYGADATGELGDDDAIHPNFTMKFVEYLEHDGVTASEAKIEAESELSDPANTPRDDEQGTLESWPPLIAMPNQRSSTSTGFRAPRSAFYRIRFTLHNNDTGEDVDIVAEMERTETIRTPGYM